MEYLLILIIIAFATVSYYIQKKDMELLCSVTSPKRGTRAERRLIIRMLRNGVHPKAIFHDLYLQKNNGNYSQIDIVVATPQGLISIEVKKYSGWLFGSEYQKYWTQILNYGQEKYRFYNPIKQNEGHIKALREQSEQFDKLPIYNIVLFAGDCTLKDVSYNSRGVFVGYDSNIMRIINSVNQLNIANYTDKKEIYRVLKNAVRNGDNVDIVTSHIAKVRRYSINQPEPSINLMINWRRFFRF